MVGWNGKVHYSASSLFFLFTLTRFGPLTEIRWSVCISKSQRILTVSFLSPHNLHLVFITPCKFFTPALYIFHWSLSDNKSPQISRTLLCILIDLINAVVWMVSAYPPISNSSSPLTKPLETVLSAPLIIGITITFMIHNFLVLWQSQTTCLFFHCLWFSMCGLLRWQSPLFGRFSVFC